MNVRKFYSSKKTGRFWLLKYIILQYVVIVCSEIVFNVIMSLPPRYLLTSYHSCLVFVYNAQFVLLPSALPSLLAIWVHELRSFLSETILHFQRPVAVSRQLLVIQNLVLRIYFQRTKNWLLLHFTSPFWNCYSVS